MRHLAIPVVAAALLLGCNLQEILEKLSQVHVVVVDASTGEPIAEAQVELNGEVLTTGADGRVTFTDIVSGTYDINVTATGYEPKTITAELTEDGVEVTVELVPTGG